MKNIFIPKCTTKLATYLNVANSTIYFWKKFKPKKYDLILRGWNHLCNEKSSVKRGSYC